MKNPHCEHPADGCPDPCPNTPKGWASNACFVSVVSEPETTPEIIGLISTINLDNITIEVAPDSPTPKVGDTIVNENGDTAVVTLVELLGIDTTRITFETPTNFGDTLENGQDVWLLVVLRTKVHRTKGCVTRTSLISKQDANEKALADAMALAAERMHYLLNS